MLDTHELAWAAGFYDGEGCLSAQRHLKPGPKSNPALFSTAMIISQTDPEVLRRFQSAVGGLGVVGGPYEQKRLKTNWNPMWQFRAQSYEESQAIVAFLWRWLSGPKRHQARTVLTSYITARKGKRAVYTKRRKDGRCALGHPIEDIRSYGCLGCIREQGRRRRARQKAERLASL